MTLTRSDEEGALCFHQAMSSSDNPAFAENGATTEQVTTGMLYQGYLNKRGRNELWVAPKTINILLLLFLVPHAFPATKPLHPLNTFTSIQYLPWDLSWNDHHTTHNAFKRPRWLLTGDLSVIVHPQGQFLLGLVYYRFVVVVVVVVIVIVWKRARGTRWRWGGGCSGVQWGGVLQTAEQRTSGHLAYHCQGGSATWEFICWCEKRGVTVELRVIIMIFSREFIKNTFIPSGSQLSPSCISVYPIAQEHCAPKVSIESQKCIQSPLFTSHLFAITGEKRKSHS